MTRKEMKEYAKEKLDNQWYAIENFPVDMDRKPIVCCYSGMTSMLECLGFEWKRNKQGEHTIF